MKKKYIMGNWKMNMLPDEAAKYMEGINRLTTMLKGKEDVRKIVLYCKLNERRTNICRTSKYVF